MATIKRKESAALFELLDKSTLKVPKNASSLKIPNWWSSPTNPPAAAPRTAGTKMAPRPSAAPAKPLPASPNSPALQSVAPLAPSEARSADVTPQEAVSAVAVEEMPAQTRLFDPPPPNVAPPSSPSIRPPVIGVNPIQIVPLPREQSAAAVDESAANAAPAVLDEAVAVDAAPANASPVAPSSPAAADTSASGVTLGSSAAAASPADGAPAPISTAVAAPAPRAIGTTKTASEAIANGPARRTFAPQSHAPARRGWTTPRPGSFARLPVWAALSALAGLIVVIGALLFIAKRMRQTPAPTPGIPAQIAQPARDPGVNFGSGASQPAPAAGQAAIVPQFKPDLYYVIVWSIPVPATDGAKQRAWTRAGEYVAYLQKNHVDAVAEVAMDPQHNNVLLYTVVATRGFSSASAAQDYKVEIARIGDTLSRGIWKDANPKKGLGSVTHGN